MNKEIPVLKETLEFILNKQIKKKTHHLFIHKIIILIAALFSKMKIYLIIKKIISLVLLIILINKIKALLILQLLMNFIKEHLLLIINSHLLNILFNNPNNKITLIKFQIHKIMKTLLLFLIIIKIKILLIQIKIQIQNLKAILIFL
jgi:hypothetical protein